MGKDFSDQPKPPVLKRFANLDIDGVEKPERTLRPSTPKVTPTAKSERPSEALARLSDVQGLDELQAEINEHARDVAARMTPQARRAQRASELRAPSRTTSTPSFTTERTRVVVEGSPEARRNQRAAELRASRPMDPSPASAAAMARAQQNQTSFLSSRAPSRVREETLPERFPGSGGVMTMELDLRARQRPPAHAPRFSDIPSPGVLPASYASPPQVATPVTLTAVAARQIQLMAWQAGVPGSALRIMVSQSPGLGRPELEFAFDESISENDVVFEALGVTLVIDRHSLPLVRGRHISWQDLPGAEGFVVG